MRLNHGERVPHECVLSAAVSVGGNRVGGASTPRYGATGGVVDALRTGSGRIPPLWVLSSLEVALLDVRRGEATAGELVAATGLTTGAITAMIDRMERAGYLLRHRDTGDRRRVLVRTTSDARRVAGEVFGELSAIYRALVATYDDRELDVIARFVDASRSLYGQQADRLRAGG